MLCNQIQELLLLEEDVKALEEVYPQGEQVINLIENYFCIWTNMIYVAIFMSLYYLSRLRLRGL